MNIAAVGKQFADAGLDGVEVAGHRLSHVLLHGVHQPRSHTSTR
jgi:hypothetical protein